MKKNKKTEPVLSRRDFLKYSGASVGVLTINGCSASGAVEFVKQDITNSFHNAIKETDEFLENYSENIPGGLVITYKNSIEKIIGNDPYIKLYLEESGKNINEINNKIDNLFGPLSNYKKLKEGNFSRLENPFDSMLKDLEHNGITAEYLRKEFSGILYDTQGNFQRNEIYSIYYIFKIYNKTPERIDLFGENAKISYQTRKIVDKYAKSIEKNFSKAELSADINLGIGGSALLAKLAGLGIPVPDSDSIEVFDININTEENYKDFLEVVEEVNTRPEDIRYNGLDSFEEKSQRQKNKQLLFDISNRVYEIKNNFIDEFFLKKILATDEKNLPIELKNKINSLTNIIINSDSKELADSDKNLLLTTLSIITAEALVYNNAIRSQTLNFLISLLIL